MVQGRRCPRLALEAVAQLGVISKVVGEKLQCHKTAKASVPRLVNDSHAASAQLLQDPVMRDGGNRFQSLLASWASFAGQRIPEWPDRGHDPCDSHPDETAEQHFAHAAGTCNEAAFPRVIFQSG